MGNLEKGYTQIYTGNGKGKTTFLNLLREKRIYPGIA